MAGKTLDQDVQEGKFFAVISYISFLCIISLILKSKNKFALYHAKQGLVLFVFEVATFILSIIPILDWIRTLGLVVFGLVSLWCMLSAMMGNLNRLPLISNIADNIIL